MDEAVIKYYRRLLRTGFENAGSFNNPSIFLDSYEEGTSMFCGLAAEGNMNIFINIKNDTIDTIKYLCICDPTGNVAVEILCNLVKGKTLEKATDITEELFFQATEGKSEDLQKKATGLLELLRKGISRYQTNISKNSLQEDNPNQKKAGVI
ncbi:MAG: NifU protein [Thermoproteota archaeon]|nr:NifU protein [Thermoproteota archaeon]